VPFALRNHRQKRFNNRRGSKLAPPSIRANRQLELRVVRELSTLFPITAIGYEKVKADVDLTSGRKGARSGKGFSPVMVGQNWAIEQMAQFAPVYTRYGWQEDGNGTAQLRRALGLVKDKQNKSEAKPETHAIDGVALACGYFIEYRPFHQGRNHGHDWVGAVSITSAPFVVIKRPPISRRQLHLMVPAKGGGRRKYGGTITRHGFRKGDLVKAEMAGRVSVGYVSGDTERQVSVSDINWRRIGQFTASKVQLIYRATGILATCPQRLSVIGALNPAA
jgi:hypothetical protein